MLKGLIIFTFGAICGGSVAFVATKSVITKRERAIAEEKIASMKAYVDELRARDEAGVLAESLKYVTDDTNNSDNRDKKDQNKDDETVNPGTYQYTEYSSFYNKSVPGSSKGVKLDKAAYEHPEDDTFDVDEADIDEFHRRNAAAGANELMKEDKKGSEFISEEEFDDPEYAHHSKSTVFFYAVDGIIVDENDQEVVYPESTIGKPINKESFTEGDVIFCRNYKLSHDFRIELINESW